MLSIESFFYTLLLLLLALWVALNRREFGLTQFFCCIFILVYGFGFHIYHFESEYEAEVINITARWLSVSVIAIFGGIIFANFLIAKRDQKSNIGGAELPPQGLRLISLAIILLFIYHLTFGGGLQGLMGVSVLGKEDIATGEFEQLRAGAGGGAGGLYAYLSLAIAPFFALLAFAHWWQARSNFSLVLMLAFLGIVLLGKLSTLHKFPAVFFLAQIGLLAVIFNKSMARSKKVILLLIVAIGVCSNASSCLLFLYCGNWDCLR
jgi:hypothetical protein